MRSVALLAVGLALAAGLATPGAAAAAQHAKPTGKPNPIADPAHNVSPSAAFVDACSGMGTTVAANRTCDKAALPDFDKVRKSEGLGPMTLPGDFAGLSVASQLLAISNIERVDRGRRAVLGRSKSLDTLARQGAKQDRDPDFPNPFTGSSGGANWAGAGNSALLDDFYWMYDDGPGSFNEDCQHKGDPGCWGHRHDIINAYGAPVVMGAAAAYGTTDGTSMTEEFIGGDTRDKVDVSPSWHAIAATFPIRIAISASRATVSSAVAVTVTGRLTRAVVHSVVAKAVVQLQHRVAGHWVALTRGSTGAHGVVRFRLHPTRSSSYRLVALSSSGAHLAVSAAVAIAVA